MIAANPRSMEALRNVVRLAREGAVYLMCACPYNTPGRACHTYLLLDMARALDSKLKLLPEPKPANLR